MYNELYFLILNYFGNPDNLINELRGKDIDVVNRNRPHLTVAAKLASHNLQEKVAILQGLGADISCIAYGYALAGNHRKVEKYRTEYRASANIIGYGYAESGNHIEVEKYRTQHGASPNAIAMGYAQANNHSKVEAYRTQHRVSAKIIAMIYARTNNHSKVEEYRTEHGADINAIVIGYIQANNHAKVEEYRTEHGANVNFIALDYLKVNNYSKVEEYRIQHGVDVNTIATGYAKVNNHIKVEEYRTQHGAAFSAIIYGYEKAGNLEKVRTYTFMDQMVRAVSSSQRNLLQENSSNFSPQPASNSRQQDSNESIYSEKTSKTKRASDRESTESPNKKMKCFSQSHNFFQVVNRSEQEGPILTFNHNEIMHVLKILRGDNNCMNNCVHLARDLLEYFKTGKVPVFASSTTASTHEDFNVLITIDQIKREKRESYFGITHSRVALDENIFSGLPYDREIPKTSDGAYDIEADPILVVDSYNQPSARYNEIDKVLKKIASEHSQGVSFGLLNMGRSGNYVEEAGHMLVYFATPDKVYYMDAQLLNGINKIDKGCIFENINTYRFAEKNRLGPNTFGDILFYIPCGPHLLNMATVSVKKEPIDCSLPSFH